MEELISAISTASGTGGVAIIRISGAGALEIAAEMFRPSGRVKPSDFQPYRLYPGVIFADGFEDYGMAVYFKAPKSYTGEDMVEFHCHGGVAVTRGVLRKTVLLGCRQAGRGEFTKRAFLNGKLSLSSAEGLVDMINAESESGVRAGFSLYREKLLGEIESVRAELTYVLALIDANIDFPEDDLKPAELEEIRGRVQGGLDKLKKLLSTYSAGSKMKNGVNVVLCGRPNTGKSSLLNALTGKERAIVTDVAGTTRDVVEASAEFGGINYNFYDTAGLRESTDTVEREGINRSEKMLEFCDLIIFVLDGAEGMTEEDEKIYDRIKDKNPLVVSNKSDLKGKFKSVRADIELSALTGENTDKLKQLIESRALGAAIDPEAQYLTEERHKNCLERAAAALSTALKNLGSVPLDLLSLDLKESWFALGEISGETVAEEIIDEIFAKFCVGK